MQAERENLFKALKFVDFDVAGALLRAYYDADNKLVFVLDFLENDTKPNVLLVINPVGNRKWDDILMNDYGVDLETVRPKKDNKYQKLDVEYSGLSEYDDVLRLYVAGENFDDALLKLNQFRDVAAVRAATERQNDAEITAEKARETIEKTQDKITELQNKLKKLREKLGGQRADVGKEPTKQSAAKILRTEAQIDSTNEKINRARKRLDKAKKRLVAAQDEIDAATVILNKLKDVSVDDAVLLPAKPMETSLIAEVVGDDAGVFPQDLEQEAENMADDEVKPLFNKDPDVLDESIAFKPVDFQGDKPVDDNPLVPQSDFVPMFNADETKDVEYNPKNAFDALDDDEKFDFDDAELPVLQESETEQQYHFDDEDAYKPDELPVVEDKTQFGEFLPETTENDKALPADFYAQDTEEKLEPELLGGFTPLEIPKVAEEKVPEMNYDLSDVSDSEVAEENRPYEPILPQPIVAEEVDESYADDGNENDYQGVAGVEPAPVSSEFRPVSPMAMGMKSEEKAVKPVDVNVGNVRKQNVTYYIMLIVLIVLSVFTLWFYQKKAGDTTPELGVKIQNVDDVAVEDASDLKNQNIETVELQPVEVVVEEKPVESVVVADVVFDETVQPEEVPVTEPEPIVLTPEVEPVPVEPEEKKVEEIVEPENKSPFLSDQEVKLIKVETEEDVLTKKPVFDASADDSVYVAPVETVDSAETVSVAEDVTENDVPVVDYKEPVIQQVVTSEEYVAEPVVEYTEPEIEYTEPVVEYTAPVAGDSETSAADAYYAAEEAPLQQTTSEMIAETEVVETCDDGNPPDVNGCCTGEESAVIDGESMCCVIGGDECFPPLL